MSDNNFLGGGKSKLGGLVVSPGGWAAFISPRVSRFIFTDCAPGRRPPPANINKPHPPLHARPVAPLLSFPPLPASTIFLCPRTQKTKSDNFLFVSPVDFSKLAKSLRHPSSFQTRFYFSVNHATDRHDASQGRCHRLEAQVLGPCHLPGSSVPSRRSRYAFRVRMLTRNLGHDHGRDCRSMLSLFPRRAMLPSVAPTLRRQQST